MDGTDCDMDFSLNAPSLRDRLENVRRSLKQAEEQLSRWQSSHRKPESISKCHSSKYTDTRKFRLKYESHINGLEDNLRRSQEKAKNERDAYDRCLSLAEQQMEEMSQRLDNDRQQLCRRLMQIDEEVQRVEAILRKQTTVEPEQNESDQCKGRRDANNAEIPSFQMCQGSKSRELKFWKDLALRLSEQLQRERLKEGKEADVRQKLHGLGGHASSVADMDEQSLEGQRDALTLALYKLEIQQISNKLKLEKVREDLSDVFKHVTNTEMEHSKKWILLKMTAHVLKELDKIREEMGARKRRSFTGKSGRPTLSSLRDLTESVPFRNYISPKHTSMAYATRSSSMAPDLDNVSRHLAELPSFVATRVKSPGHLNWSQRKKQAVSWGGCVVLDEDENWPRQSGLGKKEG